MVRDRVDAKRVELLNVLWAETIAKTENDWAEMANQKLEMYEKVNLKAVLAYFLCLDPFILPWYSSRLRREGVLSFSSESLRSLYNNW